MCLRTIFHINSCVGVCVWMQMGGCVTWAAVSRCFYLPPAVVAFACDLCSSASWRGSCLPLNARFKMFYFLFFYRQIKCLLILLTDLRSAGMHLCYALLLLPSFAGLFYLLSLFKLFVMNTLFLTNYLLTFIHKWGYIALS